MSDGMKIGLTLAGGGAKGAYHVGVLKAIAELNIPVHSVSGASIGALNGALVAASRDMHIAYTRLNEVWTLLSEESPLKMSNKIPVNLALTVASGAAFNALPVLGSALTGVSKALDKVNPELSFSKDKILCSQPLVKLLEEYLQPAELRAGLPMYASVYESSGGMQDVSKMLLAMMGIKNTQKSDYLHLQSLSDDDMKSALLASSALPLLYRNRSVGDKVYSDGGQGDWYGETGNVPVEPLVNSGSNMVIVSHLSNGSMWNRSLYPDASIIEIRPRTPIARSLGLAGGAKDLLGFKHETITSWMVQGYEDAKVTLSRVVGLISKRSELNKSRVEVERALGSLSDSDVSLSHAFDRISLLK